VSSNGSGNALPTVSVVVPTHFRPTLLPGAVRAILNQDYQGPVECIVVFDQQDPCGIDVEVPPNRVLRQMRNDRTPGPAGAANAGLVVGTGELLAICDDDDEWLPEKLRLQVEALGRHPEASVATCGIFVTNGRTFTRLPAQELLTLEYLSASRRFEVHSSTIVVRRPALEEIGLRDESIPFSYGEDYDWHLRAARLTPLVAVRRPLVVVRTKYSYFTGQWERIIAALTYLLDHRPEIREHQENLARIYGRLAFACAASGRSREARSWARRALRLDWHQLRGYLAFLVSWRLISPTMAVRLASKFGRGV
jgi:glycosyltransferase involved in cell wall biosynthesis